MKKKTLLLILLMALLAPWAVNAQETLTVYDGTGTNSYVPFNGLYADYGTRSQYIIPAEELTAMAGGTITSLKFYSSKESLSYDEGVTVYLGEVGYTLFETAALVDWNSLTPVYTGTIEVVSNEMEITFSNPYPYEGDNLLIGFQVTTWGSSCPSSSWYGTAQTSGTYTAAYNNATSSSHSWSSTINRVAFIPKTTFTYEPAPQSDCEKPTDLHTSNITAHTATIGWNNGSGTFDVEYKKTSESTWTSKTTNYQGWGISLIDLDDNTAYKARVRSVCTDETSGWETIEFTTLVGCPEVPTNLTATVNGTTATLNWDAEDAVSWQVCVNDDMEDLIMVDNNPTYQLTGLTALTTYSVKVRTYCSNIDQSAWCTAISFTTPGSFPYSQDFSGTGIPAGWTIYTGAFDDATGTATLAPASYGWSVGTSNGVLDGNNAYANIYSTGCNKWMVAPAIPMPTGARITFDVAYTAYSGTAAAPDQTGTDDRFIVLASTDNMATWTILRKWDNAGSEYVLNDITPATLSLAFDMADYAGTNVNIAFYAESTVSNTDNNIHVDNVVFELIPSCEKPTNVAVNYESGTTATVSWTSEASAWNMRVNGTVVEGTITNPYTLTGLDLGTTYSIEIQNVCGEGNMSEWTTPVSFTTDMCLAEDQCEITFELTDSFGDGWNGAYIDVVDVETGASLAHMSNNNIAKGEQKGPKGTKGDRAAETETYTLAVCNGREIQFVWHSGSYDSECSYVVTDVIGQEIFSGSGTMSDPVDYTQNCPSCFPPMNLEETEVTAHTITITWESDAAAWQVRKDGGKPVNVTEKTYTFTGLAAQTPVVIEVRTDCGEGDYSDWVAKTITTDVACPAPTELLASDVTHEAAVISWTGEGDFELQLGTIASEKGRETITQDFESGMGDWTTIDADGDGFTWTLLSNMDDVTTYYSGQGSDVTEWAYAGNDAIFSGSYVNGASVSTTPDNILVSPQVILGGSISFYAKGLDGTYPEHFGVCVSTTGNTSADDFTVLQEWDTDTDTEYHEYTVDLSAYTGTGYIAIRDFNVEDMYIVIVDDITIVEGAAGEVTWGDIITGVTSPYELTGLDPETYYRVRVRANCGTDGYSEWVEGGFTTKATCMVPNNLTASDVTDSEATLSWSGIQDSYELQYRTAAYREELFFTDFDDEEIPAGWENTGALYYWTGTTDWWVFLGYTAAGTQYLITSDLSEYTANKADIIQFTQRYYGGAMNFKTGFSITTNDVDAFEWSADIAATSSESPYFVTIPEGAKYFAIQATSTTAESQGVIIDDFGIYGPVIEAGDWTTVTVAKEDIPYTAEGLISNRDYEWAVRGVNASCDGGYTEWSTTVHFMTEPSCLAPEDLDYEDVTNNSAVITWVSDAASFDIEVNGVMTEDVTSPYELEGLEANTEYTVKVRANCGGGDYSDWASVKVLTECNTFAIPYEYGFDDVATSYTPEVNCWIYGSLDADNPNSPGFVYRDEETGDVAFRFNSISNSEVGYDQILISPELVVETDIIVEFEYKAYNASYPESFMVGYSMDGDSYEWFDEFTADNTDDYLTYTSDVIPAGTKYVAVYYLSEYMYYLFLDNFSFTEYVEPTVTQTTQLVEGWNWVSFYVEGEPQDLLTQLETSLGENGLVIQGLTAMTEYDGDPEEPWFGTLDEIGLDNDQMYLIKTSAACTIEITGAPADPATHEITINPGWNWIGFPSAEAIDVLTAMSDFEAENEDKIQSMTGMTEYDDSDPTEPWFGTLETLEPGMGLLYFSNNEGVQTLVFQKGTGKSVRRANIGFGKLDKQNTEIKSVKLESDNKLVDNTKKAVTKESISSVKK